MALGKAQLEILSTVARYVKKGGALYYSTCSLFACENDETVRKFLKANPNFTVEALDSPLCHEKKEFGYKKFKTQEELCAALEKLYLKKLLPLIKKSISVFLPASAGRFFINTVSGKHPYGWLRFERPPPACRLQPHSRPCHHLQDPNQ